MSLIEFHMARAKTERSKPQYKLVGKNNLFTNNYSTYILVSQSLNKRKNLKHWTLI